MSVKTIEQSIPIGAIFTGVPPTAAAVGGQDIFAHPIEAGSGAGEFDFGNDDPWVLQQVFLRLGGQTIFAIKHVDRNGVETVIFEGGNEPSYLANIDNGNIPGGMIFFEGEKLRITTTGVATNVMIARISADQYRL